MNYTAKVNSIIDNNLSLPKHLEDNKEIIKSRFVEEVSFYEKKRDHTKRYYNIFRFIVTIGSIFLPAILSMGQMDPTKLPKNFDMITFWSSWSVSLMVTISNGFLQLFSLDKNYFNYSLVVEQLKTEGWQFFGLSGNYEEYDTHNKKAYKEFCKAVENIKRKQIETEFQGKGNTTKKKPDNKKPDDQKPDSEIPLLNEDSNKQTKENFKKDGDDDNSDSPKEASTDIENAVEDEINKTISSAVSGVSDMIDDAMNAGMDSLRPNISDLVNQDNQTNQDDGEEDIFKKN
jgi:gas vesicle protein